VGASSERGARHRQLTAHCSIAHRRRGSPRDPPSGNVTPKSDFCHTNLCIVVLGYHQRQRQELTVRYARLSPREKEVLDLIARGLTSRAAGEVLHIAEKTVKVHRSRLRATLQVDSVAELVLVAQTLGRV